MTSRNTSPSFDRVLRAGLATPALALTIIAGAAFAQQGGMGGRMYEVIIESSEPEHEDSRATHAEQAQDGAGRVESRARVTGRVRANQQESENAKIVIEINRVVDGREISVRRVNDEPVEVKINGRRVSSENYEVENGMVIVRDPETGKTHRVRMPSMGQNALRIGVPRASEMPDAPRVTGLGRLEQAGGGQAGQAPSQPRVMLGVVMTEPDPVLLEHLGLDASKAVVIERVIDGLPADKAGLKVKDIIVGFGDNAEPRSADDIRKVLAKAEPGKVVKLKVIRKGEPVMLELKLEAFDGAALGRTPTPTAWAEMGEEWQGERPQWERFGDWSARSKDGDAAAREEHLARAHRAMEEAAEVLARMEVELGEQAEHTHRQASEAIRQAIEAMQQGELAGIEVEEMRELQQDAVERLRRGLAENQNAQRFWAEGGPGGEGFALTVPGGSDQDDKAWSSRLEHLESRLNDLERSMERAVDRLETRTEAMMERLMERLERVIEREDREERDERHPGRR